MLRVVTSLVFFLFADALFAQPDFREEASRLAGIMTSRHVAAKPVDDAFSKLLFDSFLEKIDPEKIYFTENDIEQLRGFQFELDDEFTGKKWGFLGAFSLLLKKNLARCQGYVETNKKTAVPTLLRQPLVFSYSPYQWSKDEGALRQRWQRLFAHAVYETVLDQSQMDSVALQQLDDRYFADREGAARERFAQTEARRISYLQNPVEGFDVHLASVFLNAFAACFDPHSGYFSGTEMERFMSSFSAEGYAYGFSLEEGKNGKIQLAGVVPGSPAWRNGQLSAADQIVAVKTGNKKVDLTAVGLQEAESLISQAGNDVLEMTVKKPNGSYRSVTLKKEKIELQENVVRSYVLQEDRKIGYIALPGFYSTPDEKTEGLRCANDVAKEIIKLKKENIDGLIFDLRNNGGGSLQEALSMAGIFIEEGPLGLITDRTGVAHVVKDNNRGTVFDGPLLIMVNKLSASASEFLAAALQDYNRALVVGSATFGKGTAQIIQPLHDDREKDGSAAKGFAKITVHKVYRITGGTVQGHGLTPDIALPDVLQPLQVGESQQKNYLQRDSISKRVTYAKLPPINSAALKALSSNRVSASSQFQSAQNFVDWFAGQKLKTFTVGSWKEFVQFSSALKEKLNHLEKKQPEIKFNIINTAMNRQVLAVDHYRDQTNLRYIDELKNDQYLQECYNILKDFIHQLTVKK